MSRSVSPLPRSGPAREKLREKGQFWTPPWVARAMVDYVTGGGAGSIFDPAIGAGAFLLAAKQRAKEQGAVIDLEGMELDPMALDQALAGGLTKDDLSRVTIGDFILHPPERLLNAIVANPPYVRHHRLSASTKMALRQLGARLIGRPLDGRAGLHVYFLLQALSLLAPDGRLAFILPADTCEGRFSQALWDWIGSHYRLEAVVSFTHEASPFPGVDTNPLIFLIRNAPPAGQLMWATCRMADSPSLERWIQSGMPLTATSGFEAVQRDLSEGLETGLSRPLALKSQEGLRLAEFADVVRGIATGANDYFFLTPVQADALGIPEEFRRPAVGRTRDVTESEISSDTLAALRDRGRPTVLFSPDGRPLEQFPDTVRDYLQKGEAMGLPELALIKTRKPWYKMETRRPPAILFAYLGRRNTRFILNRAGVVPLTGFLCVYPKDSSQRGIERLIAVLNHPETLANLGRVGKSYGSGAIKVEPRALENLSLPAHLLKERGLRPAYSPTQHALPLIG